MEIKSHYYNYYGVKGRYSPQEKQKTDFEQLYTQTTDKIKSSNYDPESELFQAYLKLEDYYYDLGVENRAKYSSYEELKIALEEKYFSVDSPFYKNYTARERSAMF